MPPGLPLRLTTLAAELGVSTTPVRMALERLTADGLVIQDGRRGATIAPLSWADFQDIYAVRRCLEGAAAGLGAARMGQAERETMLELRQQLDQIGAVQGPELDRYLEVEWEMHEVCYGACHHERMLREIRSFRHQAERYFRLALAEGMNLLDDLQQQHDFCQACVAGDAEEAERMAVKLLDWTVERVAPVLAHSGAMTTAT
jgi:DNA-binding GntR family transcriptional regulator